MTEATPLVRQWILLRTLCARHYGATVKEMSDEMGVSEKTIRRDLETFQTAGFPLVEVVEDFGRKKWHIDPTKHQPGMSFAYDEAIALYLGRRFLEPLAGTVFAHERSLAGRGRSTERKRVATSASARRARTLRQSSVSPPGVPCDKPKNAKLVAMVSGDQAFR